MSVTIDALHAGLRVRIIRDFTDLHGQLVRAGQSGYIESIDCPWGSQQPTFHVKRADGSVLSFQIDLLAKDGPRHGRMKDFISHGERYEGPPDPPVVTVAPPPPPPPPPRPPEPEFSQEAFDAQVERIVLLAAHHRWDEAGQAYDELIRMPAVFREWLPDVARHMEAAAHQARDLKAFDWLYEKTVDAWWSYAGQATSGGEGTALMLNVKDARQRHAAARSIKVMSLPATSTCE